MVKPLKDILAEIEERQPTRFGFGGPSGEGMAGFGQEQDTDPEGSPDEAQDVMYSTPPTEPEGGEEGGDEYGEELDRLNQQQQILEEFEEVFGSEKDQFPDVGHMGSGKREEDSDWLATFLGGILETLIYVGTLGAVDIETTGKDILGGDISRLGENQPKGSVDIGLPFGTPLGWAGLAVPEVRFDPDPKTGEYKAELAGGFLNAPTILGNVADFLSPDKKETVVAKKEDIGPRIQNTADRSADFKTVAGAEPLFSDWQKMGGVDPEIQQQSPSQQIAEMMIEDEVDIDPSKGWSFRDSPWMTSSQGGPIEAYQVGGLAGMMNRSMMEQQLQAAMMDQQNNLWNPNRGGNRPVSQPQFPGLLGPFGPQQPRQIQQPRLEPNTYFHEHEGGKVTYPNFPKPFVNPPDTRNPLKDGNPVYPKPDRPYPILEGNTQFTPPVPPISISETTATALEPDQIEETTTIEETPIMPREIDIQMPENVTATLDFPEEVRGTANYARGGLAGFLKSMAPMAAAWALGPTGSALWPTLAGAGTSYALGGKKRGVLDAVKGGLMGYSGYKVGELGRGLENVEGTFDERIFDQRLEDVPSTFGRSPYTKRVPSVYDEARKMGEARKWSGHWPEDYGKALGEQATGIKKLFSEGSMDMLKGAGAELIPAIASGAMASSITPPSEMPEFTEIEVEQIKTMTPEKRRQYILNKRKQYPSTLGQPTVFARPNVGTGRWQPNVVPGWQPTSAARGGTVSPNKAVAMSDEGLGGMGLLGSLLQKVIAERQAQGLPLPFMDSDPDRKDQIDIQEGIFAEAADGGVMEVDEEMESGSFVLPADVVSDVGDGSSDSGHRRLTKLFGGKDEYALGGGTGILKGPIKGVGSGLDDLIQTGIDGVRVARLSSDEFVVPKDVVRDLGKGSQKAGSEKLYNFMKDVRLNKHGTNKQPKEIHMSGLRKMV